MMGGNRAHFFYSTLWVFSIVLLTTRYYVGAKDAVTCPMHVQARGISTLTPPLIKKIYVSRKKKSQDEETSRDGSSSADSNTSSDSSNSMDSSLSDDKSAEDTQNSKAASTDSDAIGSNEGNTNNDDDTGGVGEIDDNTGGDEGAGDEIEGDVIHDDTILDDENNGEDGVEDDGNILGDENDGEDDVEEDGGVVGNSENNVDEPDEEPTPDAENDNFPTSPTDEETPATTAQIRSQLTTATIPPAPIPSSSSTSPPTTSSITTTTLPPLITTASPPPETTTSVPVTTTESPLPETLAPGPTTSTPPETTTPSPVLTEAEPLANVNNPLGNLDGTSRNLRYLQNLDSSNALSDSSGSQEPEIGSQEESEIEELTSHSSGEFICNEDFYNTWKKKNITCNGEELNVEKAVDAAKCVIYSGQVGGNSDPTCLSICSFPACVKQGSKYRWEYAYHNGIYGDVYEKVTIDTFIPHEMIEGLTNRQIDENVSPFTNPFHSSNQCDYNTQNSFASCECPAKEVEEELSDYEVAVLQGYIPEDATTDAGSILAPAGEGVVGLTVAISGMSVIASGLSGTAVGSVFGGTTATTVGSASLSSLSFGVITIEICQFAVMINQLDLKGKSAVLAMIGQKLAPTNFLFFPFGKLDHDSIPVVVERSRQNRRLEATSISDFSGFGKYSRLVGIAEEYYFIVTVTGIIVVLAAIPLLFGIFYFVASKTFMKDHPDNLAVFYNKMIGLEITVVVLSQFSIASAASYKIQHSYTNDVVFLNLQTMLAIFALLLCLGIIFASWYIVYINEEDIRDVGKPTHVIKPICDRFGPLYQDYKYHARYFFLVKMTLAFGKGVITGYVAATSTSQLIVLLVLHIFFFIAVEAQSPYHSRTVQFVTVFKVAMEITTLALSHFLMELKTQDEKPDPTQNSISLYIGGLNVLVILALMLGMAYSFYSKWKLIQEAKGLKNDHTENNIQTVQISDENENEDSKENDRGGAERAD